MLNKSYRSTYEVITFAKHIKNIAAYAYGTIILLNHPVESFSK